jgi:threonine aldolase
VTVSFLDTSTEPTEAMRDAMRDARVGDDVYGRDPTVNELEERAAALLGKEACVLVPTGTMANLVALLALTSRGDAVVLEEQSHIACAEAGGVASVAGCMPLLVAGRHGVLRPEPVAGVLLPPDEHRPLPTLLCLENTHNRGGGTVTTPAETAALRALCDEHALRLHLDGARLFNAAVALEAEPAALAAGAHTVSFCLSKGLGAPVGSVLAGPAQTIALARRMRKLLGGGMRQAGVLAAAVVRVLQAQERRLRTVLVRRQEHALDVLRPQHAAPAGDEQRHAPGDGGDAAGFGARDVRLLLQHDGVPARRQREQRDEVRHRPRRHEHARLLAQQRRGALLELVDGRVAPVDVVADARVAHRVAHLLGRLGRRVEEADDHASAGSTCFRISSS